MKINFQEWEPNCDTLFKLEKNSAIVFYDQHDNDFKVYLKLPTGILIREGLKELLSEEDTYRLQRPFAPLYRAPYAHWTEKDKALVKATIEQRAELLLRNKEIRIIDSQITRHINEWVNIRHFSGLIDAIHLLERNYLTKQRLQAEDFNNVLAVLENTLQQVINTSAEAFNYFHGSQFYDARTPALNLLVDMKKRLLFLQAHPKAVNAYQITRRKKGYGSADIIYSHPENLRKIQESYRDEIKEVEVTDEEMAKSVFAHKRPRLR